ncbi:MAG: chemotaxis protein CheA [Acidimicrobiales bacterium]
MGIDITRFQETFLEESFEGLEIMESGLLQLEGGAHATESINTIFRAAHSIKGGAGTLGFGAVAEFTHLIETLLDRRRSGDGEMTQDTVDVLLASVDCLREMLSAVRGGTSADVVRTTEVEQRLQHLLDDDRHDDGVPAGADAMGEPGLEAPLSLTEAAPTSTATASWLIEFAPHATMFHSGNDPVRILAELRDLADPGTYQVRADTSRLPDLEQLDPELSYCAWSVELATAADRTAFDEVFAWIEGEADIAIAPLTSHHETGTEPAPGATDRPEVDQLAGSPAPVEPSGPDLPNGMERRSGGDRRQSDRSASAASGTSTASIRVDIDKIDTLINMVGELVITQSMLQQLASQGTAVDPEKFREGLGALERNTRELQASVMQVRMLPISFAFSRLPRLVRDLGTKLGKSVELLIHGESTELDKTVMEKIGDPLVHLVRNALDHGLEAPEVRLAAGKPETGTVTLDAYHEGGNIVIEISDDGAGLNTTRILSKARERGLVAEGEQLSERQVHDLIFHPGFSTADTVSDISGRGVGMDVVKRNINDLGGVIEVLSTPLLGTTFRIRLPLTLAILDGQVVRSGEQVFIIPLVSIVESVQIDPTLAGALAPSAQVYRHRDQVIPMIDVAELFGAGAGGESGGRQLLVVVEADGTRAGIVVDDLLAQQQIVIKSLETNFRAVPGLSGATILGDGSVAMILDVNTALLLHRRSLPAGGRAA